MPIYKMDGKKDGKQRYRVRINYIDDNGKARQTEKVIYGLPEAKELEKSLLQTMRQPLTQKNITVKQLFDEYLAAKQSEVRETTIEKNKEIITNHILDTLSDKNIQSLNSAVLQKWKNSIVAKGLSHRMNKNIYSEFRALLNFAVKMDYLPSNPLNRIGNFKNANIAPKKMDFYTPEEFLLFIAEAKKAAESRESLSEWNYYVFFNIAFYMGMRKGEIHALKWSDIYDNTIHIRRSIAQKLKGDDRETPPKNKSSIRDIQIPLPLKAVLDEHKARYQQMESFTEDFRVCGGERCLRDTSLENKNKAYSKAAGIKKIRIHDFRHSHASYLIHKGINIQEVSRRLGHTKIDITLNTYAHLYPKDTEKALEVLNEIKLTV